MNLASQNAGICNVLADKRPYKTAKNSPSVGYCHVCMLFAFPTVKRTNPIHRGDVWMKDHFVNAPTNERWHYIVTSSHIGSAHTQNDPSESTVGVLSLWSWEKYVTFRCFKCNSKRSYIYWIYLGAVLIRKTVLPGMAIPMLKIRRPNGRLIFNMEIAILR